MTMCTKIICGLGLFSATMVMASEPTGAGKSEMPKCPVMGEPINLAVSVATDDGPVFFCCKGCDKKYTAEPAKFAEAVAAQRKFLAEKPRIQVKCPVTGNPVDPNVVSDKSGTRVAFCCKGCVEKYDTDPAKYKVALANSYSYQTQCPVTGETIDPNSSVTLPDGEMIYTCCKGCTKKLIKDAEKYAAELKKLGFSFRPDKIAKAVETVAKAVPQEHQGHDHDHDHGHEGHDHD